MYRDNIARAVAFCLDIFKGYGIANAIPFFFFREIYMLYYETIIKFLNNKGEMIMKKKILLAGLAIGALLMIGASVNSIHRTISENTDKYIMNEYIKENYGEECYGTLYEGNDPERIYFIVTENGEDRYVTCINRDYYTSKYR